MKELVKKEENKPKNVEEAIKAGWKTAEEMYTTANSSRRTWDNFIADIRNAISQKSNSGYAIDCTANLVVKLGSSHKAYYHPKVEEAFQAWLMKNQANQKDLVMAEENNNWTSKKELMNNLQISSDTIEQIISDLSIRWPAATQNHIKKGGYHNSEVFYDDYLVNMITAELAKHNTNQNTGVIQKQMSTEAKEQGILLNAVANSGDLKAAQALCDLIMEKTQIQAENKRLLEQAKQMEHALNYTAVIGWKKWSDLKRELAQSFEIFQHRISFKTVAAEAGLVKETDYAERIFAEDCFPTTMISESGIDKIYDCYDR